MSSYRYGYARVSTKGEYLSIQLDLLNFYSCNEVLTEKISGTKTNRLQLERLKDKLRPEGAVVVESFLD